MENAEAAAAAAAAPRYAPDDPSLPKPWKALIDGSSGSTYYWNPESGVTQYEKPGNAADAASQFTPQHGQAAEASQYQQYVNQYSQQGHFQSPSPGQVAQQPQQQILSQTQGARQQGSQMGGGQQQYSQQQGHFQSTLPGQVAPQPQPQPHQIPSQIQGAGQQGSQMGSGQQQYAQFALDMPPRGTQVGQTPMQLGQNIPQPYGSQMVQQMLPQQGSHMLQQPVQHPSQLGQQARQHQSPPMGQSQSDHYMPQQLQHASHLQMPPQGQSNIQPHHYHRPQGPYPQDSRNGVPQRDDSDFSKINQLGTDQNGRVVGQSPSFFNSSNHGLQGSPRSGQSQSLGSPAFQNQMGQPRMLGHQHGPSPVGRDIGYDGNKQIRGGQGYPINANNDAPVVAPQHPTLAAIPTARSQQNMRIGGPPLQNVPPGHDSSLTSGAAHGMHSMYNHANVDLPMSNQAFRPPVMPGASDVMNMPTAEAYRLQHEVTATGENVPAPFMTFEATGFPPEILRELHSAGFSSPTPIQAQTWPIAVQGRDIVAIAKTGSGKTLGYLMPAFAHLRQRRNDSRYGPTVLVLAPTRELATQIQDEAIKFGRSSRVLCTCLYGGAPKGPQLDELRRGADIVVATPGRLNDILEMKQVDLRQVSLLVLDEADRMLDMGFEPQIRKIVNEMPPRRQTLMYTATWPKEVMKIASDLLHNPVQVNIGSVDELAANKSITQYVELVPQMEKQRRLEQILREQVRGSKVIIFCSTKRMCDDLARNIRRNFPAAVIHGDKNQGERDYVLNQFRSGKAPILVATDVAARGLDVKDIRVVINYDFPTGIEDYVHRIGRTGRAGATGVAYTFFSEQDWKHAADLVKVLEGADQMVPPELRQMALRSGPSFGKDRSGMNSRFDSGPAFSGGRWDSGGRGSGMRDGGFSGGRGGMRDDGFGFRGGHRDGGFGGRGMRDGAAMSSRGGRSDFGGRGNRGRGFGPPGGGYGGRPRDDFGSHDRLNTRDGYGRGRGRGRFDSRRDGRGRSRGRSYSRSPDKVRTWDRSRSSSRSRSLSRSRSRSWSRSPRRSRSRSRSRSYDRSRGRSSRSRSYERRERPARRPSGFDKLPETVFQEPKDSTALVVGSSATQHMATGSLVVNETPAETPGGVHLPDTVEPVATAGVGQVEQSASEV